MALTDRIAALVTAIATAFNSRIQNPVSGYDIAVLNGYAGTQAQWLNDIRGTRRAVDLNDLAAQVASTPEGGLITLGRFTIDATSGLRHRLSVWQVTGGVAIPASRIQLEAGTSISDQATGIAKFKLLSDAIAAATPSNVISLYGGTSEAFDSNAVLARWTGSTWQMWDSPWMTWSNGLAGVAGSNGASPGWVFTYSDWKFTGGKVKVRWSFYLNGGTASVNGQISLALPVTPPSNKPTPSSLGQVRMLRGNAEYTIVHSVATNGRVYTGVTGSDYQVAGTSSSVPTTWKQSDACSGVIEYEQV